MSRLATVLIVDDNLGFVTWLGATLAANGYPTLPASTSSAAEFLIAERLIATIDLAIVNLELTGSLELVRALRRANRVLKVIAIEDSMSIVRPSEVDAAHSRSKAGWVATVERVLDLRNASGAS